jgi:hypothetical protein
MPAVGRAFSFSFRQSRQRLVIRAARTTLAAYKKIHNMNALEAFAQKHVHIMNFLVSDQNRPQEIHIMNFSNSQLPEPNVMRSGPTRAQKTGTPSTNKGARNVMS